MFARDKTSDVVLIVDDDPWVREMMKSILVSDGYSVMTAGDGAEALQMLQLFSPTIALVITDILMPNLDGLELARRIASSYAELPVLLISGFLTRTIEEHLRRGVRFLQKPFTTRELLGMVRSALEPGPLSARGQGAA